MRAIRPIPLKLIPTDQWGSPEGSLVQAASNSGDAGLADLPWLPFALVAYLLLIGPVNLMVLKRMKRRELAWVTIPAMATIAVLGFWVAGRQRLDVTSARHATVVVAGEHPYQRSVFVLAAGKAGVYSVLVPSATGTPSLKPLLHLVATSGRHRPGGYRPKAWIGSCRSWAWEPWRPGSRPTGPSPLTHLWMVTHPSSPSPTTPVSTSSIGGR